MRKLFLIAAAVSGVVMAQTQPLPEPSPPIVPVVRPPLGAASRAGRHEDLARERVLRSAEKAEDRAESERKEQESARRLRRTER